MKTGNKVLHAVLTVTGIILCAILIPMLIINITLIVRSTASDKTPSIGGIVPQVVLTGSMSPAIETGDLIFCRQADAEDVKAGDVISFYDPESQKNAIVTHRVVAVRKNDDGSKAWQTKGDANNVEDEALVPFDNLVAVYEGARIPKAGSLVMYMQSSTGLICTVLIPLLIFIGYDLIRRMVYDRKNRKVTDAMLAELEELRAQKASPKEP